MTIEPIASTPITLKGIAGMDDVEVDGDFIFINDLLDDLGIGEIYLYELDLSVNDGEYVLVMN